MGSLGSRLRVLALASTATLSACAGDVIGDLPPPPSPAITASASAEPESGIVAEIPVDGSPCFLVEAVDRVWVTAFDGNRLFEIDPATNELVNTHRLPGGPCGMTVLGGTIWIETGNGLVLFDPARREQVERIRVPGGVFGVTPTPTGLWGVSGGDEELLQIDPDARAVVGRVEVDGPLFGLTFARGQIWLGTRDGLVRIDPKTRSVVETIDLESFEPQSLAVDANDVMWISSGIETEVLRFDLRTMRVRDRIEVGGSLFGGVVIGDSYWVSGNDGTIYRLSAESGDVVDQVELVGFGPMPAAGNLWTVDFLSNSVFRLDEPA